jgi:molecular chaperone HscB
MNYFELFGIPVQLVVDKDLIKKRYFELSRQSHPDYFVNADDKAQANALEASALLNKALKTLSNRESTIAYVLQEKGLLEEHEKYTLDPDFLMGMLELNEALAEAAMDDDAGAKEQLSQKLAAAEKEIYEPVETIITNYQEGVTTQEELLQVKDYYYKKKYLERLRQQLK